MVQAPKSARVFLSYSKTDIVAASRLYNELKSYNIDIWFDSESLLVGQNWRATIDTVIKECDFFLVLLSSHSVDRVGYLQKELRTAIDKLDLFPETGIYILPVRLDDCKPAHRRIHDLHWIDLFPESEYISGVRKILQVVRPDVAKLRSRPITMTKQDVVDMARERGFYHKQVNPAGLGIAHRYRMSRQQGKLLIFDEASGLLWQKDGSDTPVRYGVLKSHLNLLNQEAYAGYSDWRIPTLEEAMSLMEPKATSDGLHDNIGVEQGVLRALKPSWAKQHINSLFGRTQNRIWTSDRESSSTVWGACFDFGDCREDDIEAPIFRFFVRAVRSGGTGNL